MTEREQMVRDELLLTPQEIELAIFQVTGSDWYIDLRLTEKRKAENNAITEAQLDKALAHTDSEGNRLLRVRDPLARERVQDYLLVRFGQFFKAPHNFFANADEILELIDSAKG